MGSEKNPIILIDDRDDEEIQSAPIGNPDLAVGEPEVPEMLELFPVPAINPPNIHHEHHVVAHADEVAGNLPNVILRGLETLLPPTPHIPNMHAATLLPNHGNM